jgi:hypothetical protein
MILSGENWNAGRTTLYIVGGRWMNEWSSDGMILTGENWITGRKTLYRGSGRRMNGYWEVVKWYWQGKTEMLGKQHYIVWVVGGWLSGAVVEWYWQGKTEMLGEHYIVWVVGGLLSVATVDWYWQGKTEMLGEQHYILWVVGEWMSGAVVEWYWQEKTELLVEKHYTEWVVGEWMSIEKWWNDTDGGKLYYREKTLYSICGRWMNEFWAMLEWYWQGKLNCWEKNIIQSVW